MRKLWLVLGLVSSLGLSGCGDDSSTDPNGSPFEQAKARWESKELSDYSIEQTRACFCPPPFAYTVIVQNNTVVDVAVDDPADHATGLLVAMTVDEVFDVIASALDTADEVNVEYDPEFGYPTNVFIDYSTNAADEEFARTMGNLQQTAP